MKKRFIISLFVVLCSIGTALSQERINEFVVNIDETHNPMTIYSSYGATPSDGVVIVNSTIPNLEFGILSVDKERLRKVVHDKENNRYLLIIKPNDSIYHQYTITIKATNYVRGKIEPVVVKAGFSSGFIVNPKHKGAIQVGDDLVFTIKGVSFIMKKVEGGSFWMGNGDDDFYEAERPVHKVTLSSYYIGETEVTQALWKAVMNSEPKKGFMDKYGIGDDYPAYSISWNAAQEFIAELNQLTGMNFRLPTEAEWEFAARGGNKSKGYKHAGSNNMNEVGWYWQNSGDRFLPGTDNDVDNYDRQANHCKTHPVKKKLSNELGLYDMSGNVEEWCNDWYGKYPSNPQVNPQGPSSGTSKVRRDGFYGMLAKYCRVTDRSWRGSLDGALPSIGFRLALDF